MTDYTKIDVMASKAVSASFDKVEIKLELSEVVTDYAKAFIAEATRLNPNLMEQVNLEDKELIAYLNYLLTKRVESINARVKDWYMIKTLYIPSFFQFVLSTIGEVIDRQYGITFVPVMETPSTMSFNKAKSTSDKLSYFIDDMALVVDAMPRGNQGNLNVMCSIVKAEHVRSYRDIQHPIFTYVVAMLNNSMKEDVDFAAAYRLKYDNVNFIKAALVSCNKIFH